MEKSVSLEPGKQKEIPFTLEVPQTAPPGGHFAVIWWGTAPPEGQVAIVTRAGILVYLEVSGEVNEKGELLNFSFQEGKFFVFGLPEDFAVNFKNSGNTYLKPAGEIKIKNIFGSLIAVVDVNNKERIILPEDAQALNVSKRFEKPPFAFGLYKAELALSWGEKQNDIQKSIYLFVFPWKVVLLAIIILAILYLLIIKGIKKYNQWIIKKYSGQPPPEPPEPPKTPEFIPETKKESKKSNTKTKKIQRKSRLYK